MKYNQFLIFEICRECNLGEKHALCPNQHPERYANLDTSTPLTNEKIIELAIEAYKEHEFIGYVGFHYYNEPLLEKRRILQIITAVREEVPHAKFVLWTNGTMFDESTTWLGVFDKIVVTNYAREKFPQLKDHKDVTILKAALDKRIELDGGKFNKKPCVRPYAEFIVDYYGNVHLCCMDWKGEVEIGNVHKEPLKQLIAKRNSIRSTLIGKYCHTTAPEACKRCRYHHTELVEHFGPEIYREQMQHRQWHMDYQLRPQDTAVVLTSYKVPTHRLYEHFEWNDAIYRCYGVKVYVVCDKKYKLPPYAEAVVYDEEMEVFNLSKTSNFGIMHARKQGHDVIVKTDVDVCFPPETFERLRCVQPRECMDCLYLMSANYPERRWKYEPQPGARGTLTMTAYNWAKVRYNEDCKGYGWEDGIMIHDIEKAGIQLNRNFFIWHIAHVPDTCQTNGEGRGDYWNRESGFNPDMNGPNSLLHPKKKKRKRK